MRVEGEAAADHAVARGAGAVAEGTADALTLYRVARQYVARHSFDQADRPGERTVVTFQDGEEIWGTLTGDVEGQLGFFLIPADSEDNNIRIFVVRAALKDMRAVS